MRKVRDSCGSSGTGETPQALRAEEAHRPPHGKQASWSANQPTQYYFKSNKVCENSLKQKLIQVDWNGLRDSYGSSGTGETPQGVYAEEAHRPLRGKRATLWNQPHRSSW
ncbi:hypothetical protein A6K24_05165 [Metabacillus litoralis]|uniref:Uncharacterized protein n=1 Tax=Metabacillus litoralis TaxID=152268 RepID=A0A179SX88_9BACI|nr:hypothetical protein A6K24_05165 [Metabacillus litoralis]